MPHNSAHHEERPRRATLVDVARHAGVSTASASKVLRNAYGVSDAMRDRVHASMGALGYRPHKLARGMRGKTFTVGMMVSDLDNPFFSLIADGISKVVHAKDYELLIAPGGYSAESQRHVVDALIDHQMDGLILVAPVVSDDDLNRMADEVPLVVVGRHSDSELLDSVSGDDRLGARVVVDHLVELGHEKIAFVANVRDESEPDRPESVRLRGFIDAMAVHGLEDSATVIDSHWSLEGGRAAARALEAIADPPTAVFAGADVVALGIINELWEQNRRIPAAFSLVGYDNSRTSSFGPIALTTVDQSGHEMGETAGRLIMERIDGRGTSDHVLLQPHLVIRGTTAASA